MKSGNPKIRGSDRVVPAHEKACSSMRLCGMRIEWPIHVSYSVFRDYATGALYAMMTQGERDHIIRHSHVDELQPIHGITFPMSQRTQDWMAARMQHIRREKVSGALL